MTFRGYFQGRTHNDSLYRHSEAAFFKDSRGNLKKALFLLRHSEESFQCSWKDDVGISTKRTLTYYAQTPQILTSFQFHWKDSE